MDKISEIIRIIIEDSRKYRRVVMSLAVIVVFVTTYLMILPAITLETDKADKMAGIRLRETSADTVSGEADYSSEQQLTDGADTDNRDFDTGTDSAHNTNQPETAEDIDYITDEDVDAGTSEGNRPETSDAEESESSSDMEPDADAVTDADVGSDEEDSNVQKQLKCE